MHAVKVSVEFQNIVVQVLRMSDINYTNQKENILPYYENFLYYWILPC